MRTRFRLVSAVLLTVLALLLPSAAAGQPPADELVLVTGQGGDGWGRQEAWKEPGMVVLTTYLPFIPAPPPEPFEDEELVFLGDDGRIQVADPYVAPGYVEVDWQSPGAGWDGVVLGDFNGDGEEEILTFQGGRARIFDPVVQLGGVAASGEWNLDSPFEWYNIATGDIDADGRDEILLLRTDDAPGNIQSRLLVYDGNATGTGWALQKDLGYGARWDDVALGRVDTDGPEDIGLIRDDDKRLLILNPVDWSPLHDARYSFPWLDLEMINTHKGSGADKTEIVLSRSEVQGILPSVLAFRWSSGTSIMDVWQDYFFPYFNEIEGGDLNGDGDQEIIMYRNRNSVEITLSSRNIAGAAMREFEPAGGNSPGGGWLNMKAGDLEGDGRDEVILVRSGKYRVYDLPEATDHFYDVSGSFRASFAVGDLDG
jgi:hypothetical protein